MAASLKKRIHTLLTHQWADMDALLALFLLLFYGHRKFLNIADAKILFVPAGHMPEGMTAEELENHGVLAVDTGNGRFDTHVAAGQEQREDAKGTCASMLVARYIFGGRENILPEVSRLLDYVERADTTGRSTNHAWGRKVALKGVIEGLGLVYTDEQERAQAVFMVFQAIVTAERARTSGNPVEPLSHKAMGQLFASWLNLEYGTENGISDDAFDAPHPAQATAHELGIEKNRELKQLLQFFSDYDETWVERLAQDGRDRRGNTIRGSREDMAVVLPTMIMGLIEMSREDTLDVLFSWFSGLVGMEREEQQAQRDFRKSGGVIETRYGTVGFTHSDSLRAMAPLGQKGCDVRIATMSNGLTGITLSHNGKRTDITECAKMIRTAEAMWSGRVHLLDRSTLNSLGTVEKWFLHDSLHILANGGRKNMEAEPTRLSLRVIAEVCACWLDWRRPLPASLTGLREIMKGGI